MIVLSVLAPAGSPFRGSDNSQKIQRVYFVVTPSGNYPALGDTMDFTTLNDVAKSEYAPIFVEIESQKSGGVSGFEYRYTPGNPATMANGKFQLMVQGGAGPAAPLADAGAIAYPAGVLADTIVGYADFIRV